MVQANEIPTIDKPGEKEQYKCCCCISIRCGLIWMIIFEILEILISLNLVTQTWNFNWDETMDLVSGIIMFILAITYILFALYIVFKFIFYLCKTRKAGSDSSLLRLQCREGMRAMMLKAVVVFLCRFVLLFTLGNFIYRFENDFPESSQKYNDFPNSILTIICVRWWQNDIERWVTGKITS